MMTHSNRWVSLSFQSTMATGLVLLFALSGACASGSSDAVLDTGRARELAFQYRQDALRLSQLADSLEAESGCAAGSVEVAKCSAASTDIAWMRQQADEAFERARLYRSQVPHNQMY